ncbi:MAG: CHASE2 domain-containing protein [Scytolyngbya sp. HA4215-MV1]|jgi:serine/threonine protein kinase/CHASE2 domain-containing sensor protein|nr:CHASE2 domain-containing protein [Scytolyngbya sp. HA4215-MV1]
MDKHSSSSSTVSNVPAARHQFSDYQTIAQTWLKRLRLNHLGHGLAGVCTLTAAISVFTQPAVVQKMERQTQTLFFTVRGTIAPPAEIVILKLDEYSLSKLDEYSPAKSDSAGLNGNSKTDSQSLKWPLERATYAAVIDRLMTAGARTVTVDVILADASSYGAADDRVLQQILKRYADRVTLAGVYEDGDIRQGGVTQFVAPLPELSKPSQSIGSVNFKPEVNGTIYQLGSEYLNQLTQTQPDLSEVVSQWQKQTPSLAEATLQAAQRSQPKLNLPVNRGNQINYYGPAGTFDQVPFRDVLDNENWNTYLEKGKYFAGKIVLIGPTAISLQDFQNTPFGKMPGVELHANAIATLLSGRAIRDALPNSAMQALFVGGGVAGAAFLQARRRIASGRLIWAIALASSWGVAGYLTFYLGNLLLPIATPITAIVLTGFGYLLIGTTSDYLKKLKLRDTLKSYAAAPIVQEILSQQDDLQDLLPAHQDEIVGRKLGARYKVIEVLSAGGFGETYLAEDTQRPGNPICVVKRLRPTSNNPKIIRLARRLFIKEAEALEKLGSHSQIPQLLAYFEEDEEFYLIQEYIDGSPLSQEMTLGKQLPEKIILVMLRELLQILVYVHQQGVIHRDIKPSNIIRRRSDNKLVLIDFGAVKELHTQIAEGEEPSNMTVGIGTRGFMPPEQCMGSPRFNSDLYAVGMTVIQALSGCQPGQFQENPKTGEILWKHRVKASHGLIAILSKMVRYDFKQRYQSASEVLKTLENLVDFSSLPLNLADLEADAIGIADPVTSTRPWPHTFGSSPAGFSTEPRELPREPVVAADNQWDLEATKAREPDPQSFSLEVTTPRDTDPEPPDSEVAPP